MSFSLSVSMKGALAFAAVAVIGGVTSAVTVFNLRDANAVVDENMSLQTLAADLAAFDRDIARQALAQKTFILTGDRDLVAELEGVTPEIERLLSNVEAATADVLPSAAADANAMAATWRSWRQEVAARQIALMRDPNTVDTARALEISGEGNAMFETLEATVDRVSDALRERQSVIAEIQHSALGRAETLTEIGAGVLLLFAVLAGVFNHRMVSRPLARLAASTRRMADGDLTVAIDARRSRDEIGQMAEALEIFRSGLDRAQQLEAEAGRQRADAAAAKRAEMEKVAAEFEATVMKLSDEMLAASEALDDTAAQLAEIAESTTAEVVAVSSSTEQATANVQTVASATEELSSSIDEINDQTNAAASVARDASDEVRRSSESIGQLAEVVDRIGE
ncbi:MAG TPA: HAMP domain-containing protein, partial [Methylomirabilota bacterium]|nr:HAMP domain-containing protein [Methylomirabilota bacterium]